MKSRACKSRLLERFRRKHSRLVVLTGARQTGKTTLATMALPETPYVSFEDPVVRPTYTGFSAADWFERYPTCVLDEVQKAPTMIETIKAVHDSHDKARYLLLGSSQILLLSRIKESLAGRVSIIELWPLTLPEMETRDWDDEPGESRLISFLRSNAGNPELLNGIPQANSTYARNRIRLEQYLSFGGMPVVHDPELTKEEKWDWLGDYRKTYLQRDVSDLANIRDLEPFTLAQQAIAAKSGTPVNFSDLARLAAVSVGTAQRFMRYLELSYQVILLRPDFRNFEKRLAKMPKVHFLDPGILRSIIGRRGNLTGSEFESAIVAEIHKQLSNAALSVQQYHLRTYDGREVDLLLELEQGFVALEIKMTNRVSPVDARHLRNLEELLDKPLLAGLILSQDNAIKQFDDSIYALPVAWALGAY